ncbi:MAG: hypothetical protein RL318_2504 [Fibrobacterota bacterium]|jgi:hypothetical protein
MHQFSSICLLLTIVGLSGCENATSPRSLPPGITSFEYRSTGGEGDSGNGNALQLDENGAVTTRYRETYRSACIDTNPCVRNVTIRSQTIRSQLTPHAMTKVNALLATDEVTRLPSHPDTGIPIAGALGWSATVIWTDGTSIHAAVIPRKCGTDACPAPRGYVVLDSLARNILGNSLPKILL